MKNQKLAVWIGSLEDDLRGFPVDVRRVMGGVPRTFRLADGPIFRVEQLPQVDARDFHGVANPRDLPQAIVAGFIGDERVVKNFRRGDNEAVGRKLLFASSD